MPFIVMFAIFVLNFHLDILTLKRLLSLLIEPLESSYCGSQEKVFKSMEMKVECCLQMNQYSGITAVSPDRSVKELMPAYIQGHILVDNLIESILHDIIYAGKSKTCSCVACYRI